MEWSNVSNVWKEMLKYFSEWNLFENDLHTMNMLRLRGVLDTCTLIWSCADACVYIYLCGSTHIILCLSIYEYVCMDMYSICRRVCLPVCVHLIPQTVYCFFWLAFVYACDCMPASVVTLASFLLNLMTFQIVLANIYLFSPKTTHSKSRYFSWCRPRLFWCV